MPRLMVGVAALLLLWTARPAVGQDGPIAVIVHPSNAVGGLSLDELRRMYLGTTVIFGSRQRVALAETESERVRFYRAVLSMNEDRVKRHWISLVFAGESATPPETFLSAEEAKRFVAARAGAIAFVPVSAVDGSVKVLPIDGLLPSDPGYTVRE